MFFRSLLCFIGAAGLIAAESQQRNPLQYLAKVEQPEILTSSQRVNAFSRFDLSFHLYESKRRLRLSLEPNEDVIPVGATVNYLDERGHITHSEPIDRKDHRVYKGTTRMQNNDGSWTNVGWARITVHRDGPDPLFEGAFAVNNDNHHLELSSTYMKTKHDLDPMLEQTEDEFMVVHRDSDVSTNPSGPLAHTELKRDVGDFSCLTNDLEYNQKPDHPIFRRAIKTGDSYWGVMPFGSLFDKRQIDTQPTGGNTGVVDRVSTIGQTAGCPSTRKVALVGVATDCGYTNSFPSTQALRRRVISLMSSASHVWESTFNISLGLQNLTISPANCPGSPQAATPWNQDCNSDLDIQDRLNLFSAWRGNLGGSNSHWTLLTQCKSGSAVGLAWLGQACVQSSFTSNTSTGGSETVSGANVVALSGSEWQIIAHETGHTFGAVHDCDSQTCGESSYVSSGQCCPLSAGTCDANSAYIMNPYISNSNINEFSACTVGNICSAILQNSINTDCLSANQDIATITGSECGNGIVEQGEQCDCGTEEDCQGNTCCDPQTCMFTPNSVCDDANQDCCNNCRFASSNSVCRPSSGTCDPEETCPGDKAQCPRDVTAPDGRSCSIPNTPEGAGDLACASGQCTSRNLQCQTVMGSYTRNSNDTYACDDTTCVLSCGSPAFGNDVCYSLQQNMLDGTPCGGGGECQNGQCNGSSFGQEVISWIDDHKGVVIGVSVGVGILLLIFIASCFCGCVRRRKRERQMAKLGPSPPPTWIPPPVAPYGAPSWQGPPQGGPLPVVSSPWAHEGQQGWRPPQSPASGPAPLYGSGILGSRSPPEQQSPPFIAQPVPGYFGNFSPPSSTRYA